MNERLKDLVKSARRGYYISQKEQYEVKKPKPPHINKYIWHFEQIDKISNIKHIHCGFGLNEGMVCYLEDSYVITVFKNGETDLFVEDEKYYTGTISDCLEKLKELLNG